MKVVSLFAGAGGLDLGMERAGFDVAGCVEIDADAQATLRANRPQWKLLAPGDIHQHRPRDLVAGLGIKRDDGTILVGGPPCQPFSKSGQWREGTTARMNDPRAETLRAFFRVMDVALPDFMLLENVKGITATRRRVTDRYEAYDVVRSSLRGINRRHGTAYEAVPLAVDTASFGVPQHRQRVFMFAARDGVALELPSATHVANPTKLSLRFATVWDSLYDLDDPDFDESLLPRGAWADLLPSIPEGSNYLFHTDHGDGEPLFGWRRRYWSFLLKLAKNRPSWTIQAQAGPATGPFHWRSRRLSVRESARLQCFPDSWTFSGSAGSARRQIGNAVPPPIGEMLGLAIRRQLLGERPRTRGESLLPVLRNDCPGPEPVAAVPDKYLHLRHTASEHPGPGLGPGIVQPEAAQNIVKAAR